MLLGSSSALLVLAWGPLSSGAAPVQAGALRADPVLLPSCCHAGAVPPEESLNWCRFTNISVLYGDKLDWTRQACWLQLICHDAAPEPLSMTSPVLPDKSAGAPVLLDEACPGGCLLPGVGEAAVYKLSCRGGGAHAMRTALGRSLGIGTSSLPNAQTVRLRTCPSMVSARL